MDIDTFRLLLNSLTTWSKIKAHDESANEGYMRSLGLQFTQRLYDYMKPEDHPGVMFQDVVIGLSEIMHGVRYNLFVCLLSLLSRIYQYRID